MTQILEYAIVGFLGMCIGILLSVLIQRAGITSRQIRRTIRRYKIHTHGSLTAEAYNALLDALESDIVNGR